MNSGNHGHGHVFPRTDGVKARCGGPYLCSLCAQDAARQDAMIFGMGYLSVDLQGRFRRIDPETIAIKMSPSSAS